MYFSNKLTLGAQLVKLNISWSALLIVYCCKTLVQVDFTEDGEFAPINGRPLWSIGIVTGNGRNRPFADLTAPFLLPESTLGRGMRS